MLSTLAPLRRRRRLVSWPWSLARFADPGGSPLRKLKPKLTLDVVVPGGSADRIRWGDWGEAVMLEFRYTHPRTAADVEIRQAVRVPRGEPLDVKIWPARGIDLLGRDAERDAAASGVGALGSVAHVRHPRTPPVERLG
jgi:hypothetical protein